MPGGVRTTDTPDGRWVKFWKLYTDPRSKTFNNAKRSALNVGYSERYADRITTMPRFIKAVGGKATDKADERRMALLDKAERNLKEFLEMPVNTLKVEKGDDDDGPSEVVLTDPALVKIKQDTTKFVAERLGKRHYAVRAELGGPGGGPILFGNIAQLLDALEGKPVKHVRPEAQGQGVENPPLLQNPGQEEAAPDVPAQ